jgi:hypothetical protein
MKAIRVRQFGDPEVLQLGEVDVPRPGPNEATWSRDLIHDARVESQLLEDKTPGFIEDESLVWDCHSRTYIHLRMR